MPEIAIIIIGVIVFTIATVATLTFGYSRMGAAAARASSIPAQGTAGPVKGAAQLPVSLRGAGTGTG